MAFVGEQINSFPSNKVDIDDKHALSGEDEFQYQSDDIMFGDPIIFIRPNKIDIKLATCLIGEREIPFPER